MAIAAVDTQPADMVLMAKRDRLFPYHVLPCDVGRTRDHKAQEDEQERRRHEQDKHEARYRVRSWMKDLHPVPLGLQVGSHSDRLQLATFGGRALGLRFRGYEDWLRRFEKAARIFPVQMLYRTMAAEPEGHDGRRYGTAFWQKRLFSRMLSLAIPDNCQASVRPVRLSPNILSPVSPPFPAPTLTNLRLHHGSILGPIKTLNPSSIAVRGGLICLGFKLRAEVLDPLGRDRRCHIVRAEADGAPLGISRIVVVGLSCGSGHCLSGVRIPAALGRLGTLGRTLIGIYPRAGFMMLKIIDRPDTAQPAPARQAVHVISLVADSARRFIRAPARCCCTSPAWRSLPHSSGLLP